MCGNGGGGRLGGVKIVDLVVDVDDMAGTGGHGSKGIFVVDVVLGVVVDMAVDINRTVGMGGVFCGNRDSRLVALVVVSNKSRLYLDSLLFAAVMLLLFSMDELEDVSNILFRVRVDVAAAAASTADSSGLRCSELF